MNYNSRRWDRLTETEQKRWRDIYAQWVSKGYPDQTAHREAWITVWGEKNDE